MTAKPALWLLAALALVGALWYSHHAGTVTQRLADQGQLADSVAKTALHYQDSLRVALNAHDNTTSRHTADVLKASQATVNASVKQTNAALATAGVVEDSARKVVANAAATVAELRASLGETLDALVADSIAFAAERAADVKARKDAADAFTAQIADLKQERATFALAASKSLEAVKRANLADIAVASNGALRKGRLEGAGGAVLLAAVVVAIVKH